MDVIELFAKGGLVMYLLLLSSIAVFALGIERLLFYHYADNGSDKFLDELYAKLKVQDKSKIADFCHNEKSLADNVAFAGVFAAINNENVEIALDIAYSEAAMKLRARLNYLSMIVTLAPLLGLLGTIAGMIESFNIFSIKAGQPLAITGGIGEALIATATGLCVAIFALIVHTYLAQKLDEMLSKLEKTASIVLGNFSRKVN